MYGGVAGEQGLTLTVTAQDDLMMAGNRELIGQARGNLRGNARRDGAVAAGAEASVTREARREADTVRLAVSDHGPGIPEVQREEALGRGNRLDEQVTGHGLGLGIVKDIVESWGCGFSCSKAHWAVCRCVSICPSVRPRKRASINVMSAVVTSTFCVPRR